MKKYIILMLFILVFSGQALAYDDGDFQIWNTDVEEFKAGDNSKIVAEEEFRWGDNADEFYYQHYDAGFFYSPEKYLTIGAGYRHIYELKKGRFKLESAPYAAVTLSWAMKELKFDDRSRFEYRHFDYQADSGRYRNKLTMKLPYKVTHMEIQPYLSDEAFIGFGGTNQLNQNRLSAGFGMNLTKAVKTEIYYMLQSTKSAGKWTDVNVLGTRIKAAF